LVGTLFAGAHLYSYTQDVVSDLVYGEDQHVRLHLYDDADAQDPASGLRRITLPRTSVHKGKKKGPELLLPGPSYCNGHGLEAG
jgi:hypothetical protein